MSGPVFRSIILTACLALASGGRSRAIDLPASRAAPAAPIALGQHRLFDRDDLRERGIERPARLAFGADGTLYILDAAARTVVSLDARGQRRFVIGGFGDQEGSRAHPIDVLADPRRRSLLVLDRGRGALIAYDSQGRMLASQPFPDDVGEEARAHGSRLARDPYGRIWLLAPRARDLWRLDERLGRAFSGRFLLPEDSLGEPTAAVFDGEGGGWLHDAASSRLARFDAAGRWRPVPTPAHEGPWELALDASGALLGADADGERILVLDEAGTVLFETVLGGPTHPFHPTSIAVGDGDRVAVADADRGEIRVFDIVREKTP